MVFQSLLEKILFHKFSTVQHIILQQYITLLW